MEILLKQFNKSPLIKRIQELTTTTKNLAFQVKGDNSRRLTVSTHLLNTFHWYYGDKIVEEVIGRGRGLRVRRAALSEKAKQVYQRSYSNRPKKEPLLQIASQQKINDAFLGASRAHIVIKQDEILLTPIFTAESFTDNAGRITMPDITVMKDAILTVLDTIKVNKLTHIDVEATPSFWESDDAIIFLTQMRRQGYKYTIQANGSYRFVINNNAELLFKDVALIDTIPAQAPPKGLSPEMRTLVAFSGGFDAHLLSLEGFTPVAGLEFCPREARDKDTDRSEDYALSLLLNSPIDSLYNEDIYHANVDFIANQHKHIDHLHVSLSCTDFTPLKTKAAKEKAIRELSSSRDMFCPTLNLIAKMQPITLSVENVPAFASTTEAAIFMARLKALGYQFEYHLLNAPDFGGLTSRKRFYLFGTLIEGALPKAETTKSTTTAWDAISFDFNSMRDVSHTVSVKKGIETGRIRTLSENKPIAPSIFRAQNRQTKDAVYCIQDGRYFQPTVAQLRVLSGMPDSFEMSFLTIEQQTSVIGQGVDASMHRAWCRQIMQFARSNFSYNVAFPEKKPVQPKLKQTPKLPETIKHEQLALFF